MVISSKIKFQIVQLDLFYSYTLEKIYLSPNWYSTPGLNPLPRYTYRSDSLLILSAEE